MKPNTERFHLWTTIAAFDELDGAKAVHEFLREQAIESRVADERKIQRLWFLAAPQAGVHVQVPEKSLAAALQVLEETPAGRAVFKSAIRCPSCNSSRVQYPQMTRKFVLPTLIAHTAVFFGLMRHECYCENCQYTWQRQQPGKTGSPRPVRAES